MAAMKRDPRQDPKRGDVVVALGTLKRRVTKIDGDTVEYSVPTNDGTWIKKPAIKLSTWRGWCSAKGASVEAIAGRALEAA